MCWKLVSWSKHVCKSEVLPSHWSDTVQKQVMGGGLRLTPFTKTLYHQNGFEAFILRWKNDKMSLLQSAQSLFALFAVLFTARRWEQQAVSCHAAHSRHLISASSLLQMLDSAVNRINQGFEARCVHACQHVHSRLIKTSKADKGGYLLQLKDVTHCLIYQLNSR